jgi:hypothetical protein
LGHINEEIVRLFFEVNGFLVRTNFPYRVGKGSPDSDIDLAVANTRVPAHPSQALLLEKDEVRTIARAIIEVKGYHTERFVPSILDDEMFRFSSREATRAASDFFGGKDFQRVFVLSRLPATPAVRAKALSFMKSRGVDHVIEFHTVLERLVHWVREEPDYDSEFLQAIRLLKNYGYLPVMPEGS